MKALNIKRKLTLIIAAFVMATAFAVFPADTHASSATEFKFDIPKSLYISKYYGETIAIWLTPVNGRYNEEGTYVDDQKAITAKSSKPKVIKVVKDQGRCVMIPKKKGKSRITVTFKDENGATRTLSKVFIVRTYPSFIKSLRVNGKKANFKRDINRTECFTKKTKVKIKFALKKGWKRTEISGYYIKRNGDKIEMPEKELKKALKGKTFKFPKKYRKMNVTTRIQKGEDYLDYEVAFIKK